MNYKILLSFLSFYLVFLFSTGTVYSNGRDLLEEMRVPAENGKTIIINTFSGNVKITGGDDTQLSLKVYGNQENKDNYKLESASTDKNIKVDCTKKTESASIQSDENIDLSFEITIPDREDVNIKTGKGNLVVHNVKGKIKLYTVEGSIDAKDVSESVYGVSGGGDISVDNCQGDVSLISSGGNLSVLDFAGPVMAFTDGGNIHLRGANAPVCASTGGGIIELDYIGKNYGIILNNESGDIRLNVPDKFEADLNLLTDKGRISGSLDNKNNKNFVIAPLNGGGKKLYCVTIDGNIEFNMKNN
jgi:DUF4097 and DUF4098 domain-containing protein YvlB